MAAASHQTVAVMLALIALFSSVGGAIGSSVVGAIWTNTLPSELERLLPSDLKSNSTAIYDSLVVQLSYPMGSPARNAIIEAYGIAQKRMCIAATCVLLLGLGAVLSWRNIDVRQHKQVKGRVV